MLPTVLKFEIPASPGFGGKDSGQSLNLESSLSKQSNGNIRIESLNHGNKRPNPVQPSSTLLNNGGVIPNAQPSKHITFNHDGGRSHEELSIKANPTSGGTLTKGCKPSLHSHVENQKRTFVGMDKQVKNTPVISSHMLQKAAVEHGTAIRHEKNCLTSLSRAQVYILVDTVLRNHPKEVHQYRSSEKKELIVFYLAGVAMGICKRKAEPSMLDMVLREKLNEITLVTTKRNVQREETRNGGNVGP
ncbi:hypothetical protein Cgig2_001987 [Carnegiea gigantea]|uniref:Uncharacterized protein n=1 Tax=Carnegiea gigantea TaxID=171969 RepID=A0A9Q1K1U4_9CARY|nr:hypothetical protein Cgig2_001987 [Carnegiea gigantea]